MSDKVNICTKHHTSYVTECHSCYREETECQHGVPFDSECRECIEDKLITAGITKRGKTTNLHKFHDDVRNIGYTIGEVTEEVYSKWANGNKSLSETIEEVSCEEKSHPLKNHDSKHYSMVDGIEAVDRLEQMYSREDLMAWAKISAMKYRLRIGNKDDVAKEATKIKTFEAYYKHLEALGDE